MSSKLVLDFNPLRKPKNYSGWVLAIVSLVLLLLVIADFLHTENVIAQINSAQSQVAANTPQKTRSRQQRKLGKIWEIVEQETQVPWEALFGHLEAVGMLNDENVALLELRPDSSRQDLTILGEARSITGVLTYLRELQAESDLYDIRLVGHEVIIGQRERPILFELQADWRVKS